MKKFSIIVLFILLPLFVHGQSAITLSVIGEGTTKDEAVNNALRLAIEQSYGSFVSTNTSILNDEVIKDEVATLSSGNVQSFEILSHDINNITHSVLVRVSVSITNLSNYVKNHGSTCELNGSVFGANLKLFELNKKNSEMALKHLYSRLNALSNTVFDFELKLGEPVLDDKLDGYVKIPMQIHYRANENTKQFYNVLQNTLNGIQVSSLDVPSMQARGYKLFPYLVYDFSKYNQNISSLNVLESPIKYLYSPIDKNELNLIFSKAILSFSISDNLSGNYEVYTSDKGPLSDVGRTNDDKASTHWNSGSESFPRFK